MLDQQVRAEHERRHFVLEQDGSRDHLAQADGLHVADQHGADIVEGVDGEGASARAMSDEHGLHVAGLDGDLGIRGSCQGCDGDNWNDNVLPPDLDPYGRTSFHTFEAWGRQAEKPSTAWEGSPNMRSSASTRSRGCGRL